MTLAIIVCCLTLTFYFFNESENNHEKVSSDNYSTQGLIENDFKAGEISLEQKWLYIFYAIYGNDKLPRKYQSKVGWSPTMLFMEFNDLLESGEVCNFSTFAKSEIESISNRDFKNFCST